MNDEIIVCKQEEIGSMELHIVCRAVSEYDRQDMNEKIIVCKEIIASKIKYVHGITRFCVILSQCDNLEMNE